MKGEHPHIHMIISANKRKIKDRHWLTTTEYNNVIREMNLYQVRKYPELENSQVKLSEVERKRGARKTRSEREQERRTRKQATSDRKTSRSSKPNKKQQVLETLHNAIHQAYSKQEFTQNLQQAKLELYKR